MYKEDFYCLCKSYMNRHVRVQTKSGRTYDGMIIGVDPNYIRLKVSGGQGQGYGYGPDMGYGQGYIAGHVNGYGRTAPYGQPLDESEERAFFPPAPGFPGYPGYPGPSNETILTLALFDLLTLVLLM
ncbi:LSm family protein [Paenibacillus chitinolyticus]|uniref:hypothetical protein n=1 Tax=Paenibacillus chitinolyticus TaxID=79263 RepID=UPI00366B5E5F